MPFLLTCYLLSMPEIIQSPVVPSLVRRIADAAKRRGGRAIVVGGAVRDAILGHTPKDFDMELFDVTEADVETLLADVGDGVHVERVGRSFPVWKAWDARGSMADAIDVALPRREIKMGQGHTDFFVMLDPRMSFVEASARRDFTVNAIGFDPIEERFLDPHAGIENLRAGVLRHVSHHFDEDPLRVLRGMQLCARFGLQAAETTIARCRNLSPEHLSCERIMGEFDKLILRGAKPSLGLAFLRTTGWVEHFPELAALIGVQQDPGHHPEGDAWVHTLHCVDALPQVRTGNESDDRVLGYGVLCHDLGKPATAALIDGKWRAYGHEAAGDAPTRAFLGRMTAETDFVNQVCGLVVNHMRPKFAYKEHKDGGNADRSVRRLSNITRLDLLSRVVRCDDAGRPPRPPHSHAADWLDESAARLGVAARRPVPLVQGRDLIAAGYAPGKHFGPILSAVFEQQLDGAIGSAESALHAAIAALAAQGIEPEQTLSRVKRAGHAPSL